VKKLVTSVFAISTLAACQRDIAPEDGTCRQIDDRSFEIISTHDGSVIAYTSDAQPFISNPGELRGTFNIEFDLSNNGYFRVTLSGEEKKCSYRSGDWVNNYQLVVN